MSGIVVVVVPNRRLTPPGLLRYHPGPPSSPRDSFGKTKKKDKRNKRNKRNKKNKRQRQSKTMRQKPA